MRTRIVLLALLAVAASSGECDPSTRPPYDPCAGKACGDSCSVCPPDDADCVETADVKGCDRFGSCTGAVVPWLCYDPCAGKACGASCTVCPPDATDATDCAETAVVKACDPQGRCVPDSGELCSATAACAGKACGDPCTIDPPCRDSVPPCMMPSVAGRCDAAGACIPGDLATCAPHPDCVGKACGDSCDPCGPDASCPTFAATECDAAGRCIGGAPAVCP